MILYTIILMLTALIFGVMAVLIYKGETELIHDYHQKNVKDKTAYGKAFGKAMATMALVMAISGVAALFYMLVAVAALVLGLAGAVVIILGVQKKYNGGVFSNYDKPEA